MSYVAEITRKADGLALRKVFDLPWENDDGDEYLWSDGNFGCDCNRGMWFDQMLGVPDSGYPCSTTFEDALFSVRIFSDEGKLMYDDETGLAG